MRQIREREVDKNIQRIYRTNNISERRLKSGRGEAIEKWTKLERPYHEIEDLVVYQLVKRIHLSESRKKRQDIHTNTMVFLRTSCL